MKRGQLGLFIREYVAIKLLECAMYIAPKDMSFAIAKGIYLTFPALADKIRQEIK